MISSSKIILYQAFNLLSIYNQVLFSIITLHYQLKGKFDVVRVVVYTDNPEFFAYYVGKIPISIEVLSKEQIQFYKGEKNFIHRAKICVIQDCFSKYKSDI